MKKKTNSVFATFSTHPSELQRYKKPKLIRNRTVIFLIFKTGAFQSSVSFLHVRRALRFQFVRTFDKRERIIGRRQKRIFAVIKKRAFSVHVRLSKHASVRGNGRRIRLKGENTLNIEVRAHSLHLKTILRSRMKIDSQYNNRRYKNDNLRIYRNN